MATKEDIQSDITLELGDGVSPEQLAKAVLTLNTLLDHTYQKITNGDTMRWTVQLKEGSNLVEMHPVKETKANSVLITTIQNGITQFKNGAEQPEDFNEDMMKDIKKLSGQVGDTQNKTPEMRLWLQRKGNDITPTIYKNVTDTLNKENFPYETFSAIEGTIEKLVTDTHSEKDKWEFAIYDPVYEKKITCTPQTDAIKKQAHKLFGERIEAEGIIKYDGEGIPTVMCVQHLECLPKKDNLPDYRETRGILKDYV